MTTMTAEVTLPPAGEPFTVEDLGRMPDDGHRYELIDGTLMVSAAPNLPHQRVATMLGFLLERACPADLIVFGAEVNLRLNSTSEVLPDFCVARAEDAVGVRFTTPPLMVGEVLSPDSVLRDLNLKKAAYERFSVPSYWVIDPDLDKPGLRVFEFDGACYKEVAHVTGDEAFRAERPFPVEIVPAQLVDKLRRASPQYSPGGTTPRTPRRGG